VENLLAYVNQHSGLRPWVHGGPKGYGDGRSNHGQGSLIVGTRFPAADTMAGELGFSLEQCFPCWLATKLAWDERVEHG
jgi:hypothetical protein